MNATMLRKKCKFGIFIVHNHDGEIWAEVEKKLYHWVDSATSGYPGCIEHGGNFLNGTEYRKSATSGGDWVEYPHLEYGYVVVMAGLGFGANFFPSYDDVKNVLNGKNITGWERRNPEGGHNNEWIPLSKEPR